MKLKVDDIEFYLHVNESDLNGKKTPVVFLHGFTGNSDDWNFLFRQLPENIFPLAIDLIGHGRSDSPKDPAHYTCTAIVHHLHSILLSLKLEKIILAGYSMGGRAALSYCLKHPNNVIAAVLESTTAGIEDFDQKKERVEIDFLLADKIRSEGIVSFIEYWFSTPLFRTLKDHPDFENIRKRRIENSATGLANSLMNFSTGLMRSYWESLPLLNFPILLVSGELDNKYTSINSRMKLKFQNALHAVVPECGHNVHIEKPELFTKLVQEFLEKLERPA